MPSLEEYGTVAGHEAVGAAFNMASVAGHEPV